eukprot:m.131988 g.131988  ORF g.131988 m.131988 type:complete len:363 (+) comp29579_c0_seq2:304-1392(+)
MPCCHECSPADHAAWYANCYSCPTEGELGCYGCTFFPCCFAMGVPSQEVQFSWSPVLKGNFGKMRDAIVMSNDRLFFELERDGMYSGSVGKRFTVEAHDQYGANPDNYTDENCCILCCWPAKRYTVTEHSNLENNADGNARGLDDTNNNDNDVENGNDNDNDGNDNNNADIDNNQKPGHTWLELAQEYNNKTAIPLLQILSNGNQCADAHVQTLSGDMYLLKNWWFEHDLHATFLKQNPSIKDELGVNRVELIAQGSGKKGSHKKSSQAIKQCLLKQQAAGKKCSLVALWKSDDHNSDDSNEEEEEEDEEDEDEDEERENEGPNVDLDNDRNQNEAQLLIRQPIIHQPTRIQLPNQIIELEV